MKVDVHHIPSNGLDLVFLKPATTFESLNNLVVSGVCDFITPVAIELNISPVKDFFKVKGGIETTVRQGCVRCLEDFDLNLKNYFDLNYSNEIPADLSHKDNAGTELTAQQIGLIFFDGDEINFTEALQEQVVLAMPYKPLCHDGCKGLCCQCGQNLNNNPCRCEERTVDGPFAVLKNVKLPSR